MIKRCLSFFFRTGGLLLLMLFLLPSSRVFASSSHQMSPNAGFIDTCDSLDIASTGILNGYCRTANGNVQFTVLDLNNHIGNIDGALVENSSNFVGSCFNISGLRMTGDLWLHAVCYAKDGKTWNQYLGLTAFISNINGTLVWAV